MNIRTRLTLIFFCLVIVVLTAVSISIYFFSANARRQDFYRRLQNRAINTTKILTEVNEVNARLLRRIEQNNPASLPNQYIAIYNSKNELVYSSRDTASVTVTNEILNNARASRRLEYDGGKFGVVVFLFDGRQPLTVVAAATDVYGAGDLRSLRKILLINLCVSIVFVSALGWIYSGRVLRPISRIVREVGDITEMNLNRRLDEGNKKDELSQLSQTFNRMLARLQGAFISQKNFIANASHEIKTPLTVMSGKIEVSLLQPREREYYIDVLRSVLQGLKGLNGLSTQLLLLAQTSTDQPQNNFSQLRVDDVLWETKEELLKAYPQCTIDIDFDLNVDTNALIIRGDEQLMKAAMLNLMDNACKYSDTKKVSVNLTSYETGVLTIRFTNTGNGIEHDQIERIFEPFYRGDKHQRVKGYGIGLSLVSRIVHLHGGSINVSSIPGEVTDFVVKLPLSVA